ncbi:MAG: hypothetical protein KatS3mg003_1445 [Candidatus Nitrosocaldaceae archaeon]|nr:MAG: hypothetical protein KatS3mg003_1445 [Candidatus Nitrosocaldaceae archaeon]
MQYNNMIKMLGIVTIALLLIPTISYAVQQYGYHAIKPSGSFSEILGVKGKIYPYASSTTDHVDRMIYLFTTANPKLSIGIGHVDFGNGAIYYTGYFDEGLNDDVHYILGGSPTNWYTAEVVTPNTSSTTYYWKINGITKGSYDCSTCNPITLAGATSWGNNANSVYGNFKDLQLKRNTDTQYQYFQSIVNLKKCKELPSTLGFEYPLSGNSINQLIVDATTQHECTGDVSDQWLYRGGNWG